MSLFHLAAVKCWIELNLSFFKFKLQLLSSNFTCFRITKFISDVAVSAFPAISNADIDKNQNIPGEKLRSDYFYGEKNKDAALSLRTIYPTQAPCFTPWSR